MGCGDFDRDRGIIVDPGETPLAAAWAYEPGFDLLMTFRGRTVVTNTGFLLLVSFLEVDGAGAPEDDDCAGARGDLGHAEA